MLVDLAFKTSKRKCKGALGTLILAAASISAPEKGARAGDAAFGEYLSAECVTCHQISGHATGGIPPIVGLPEDLFVEAMLSYKTGRRDNEVMRNIAARLSAEEMAALAAYFAEQGEKHR